METNKYSEYCINIEDIAYVVQFCHVDSASQLLAVGTNSRLSIFLCKFKEDDEEIESFEYEHLYDFQTGCRVTALAWSPETNIISLPNVLRVAAAGSDSKIRIFSTDLKGNDSVQVLEGHSDFVNSLTFDPSLGDQLVSTGDDQWCRLWDRDGRQVIRFPLGAPGMAVCWHHEEPLKVLVALKTGVIKIFSLTRQQQMMSFETGEVPLMDADWSVGNKGLSVGAVAGTDWFMFDVSVSSRPIDKRQIHVEGARLCRWARCHDSLVATLGRPGRQIKVFNINLQQNPLSISQPVMYDLSWHHKLPALAVGGDHRVHIYMVDSL